MTRALQLHFTSCRRGERGGSGFQVRASTPGLRKDEKAEIQAHSGYTLPREADPHADLEALPRSFRSYPLSSGRWALTRTVYTGQDYTGRWGNFFSHTLVLDQPPPTWPLDLLFWEGWVEGLAPEDDTDETPPPLPEAQLVEEEPAYPLEEVASFLEERPEARPAMERALRSLCHGSDRPLVVRDAHQEEREWLAAIHRALPLQIARGLSLSTYQTDTQHMARLNGTVAGASLALDDTQRRYQVYVLDLPDGPHSEAPDSPERWPVVVSGWLLDDLDALQRWHTLAGTLHDLELHDLEAVLELFELLEQQRPPSQPAEVLALVLRQPSEGTRAALVERLGERVVRLAETPEVRRDLALTLVEMSDSPWEDPAVIAAVQASLDDDPSLAAPLLDRDETRPPEVEAFLREALARSLDGEERARLALDWLLDESPLSPELARQCPIWASELVGAVDGDLQEAQVVKQAARRADVTLSPHRPRLLELYHRARIGPEASPDLYTEYCQDALRLPEAERDAWVEGVVHSLLQTMEPEPGLRAWLPQRGSRVRDGILEALEERLVSMEEGDFFAIDDALTARWTGVAGSMEAWTAMRQRVARRRLSISQRLRRLLPWGSREG